MPDACGGRQPRRGLLAACIGGGEHGVSTYGGVETAVDALASTTRTLRDDLRSERAANELFREGMSREQKRVMRKLGELGGEHSLDEKEEAGLTKKRSARSSARSSKTTNGGWFGSVTSATASALLVVFLVVVGLLGYAAVTNKSEGFEGGDSALRRQKSDKRAESFDKHASFGSLVRDVFASRKQNKEMLERLDATSLEPRTLRESSLDERGWGGDDDDVAKETETKRIGDASFEPRNIRYGAERTPDAKRTPEPHNREEENTPRVVDWENMRHALGPEIARAGLTQVTSAAVAAAFSAGRAAASEARSEEVRGDSGSDPQQSWQRSTQSESSTVDTGGTSRLAMGSLYVDRPESSVLLLTPSRHLVDQTAQFSTTQPSDDDVALRERAIAVASAAAGAASDLERDLEWTTRASTRVRGYQEKMHRLLMALKQRRTQGGEASAVSAEVCRGVETVRVWEEKIAARFSQARTNADGALDVLEQLDIFMESLRQTRLEMTHGDVDFSPKNREVVAALDEWLGTLEVRRSALRLATARNARTSGDADDALVQLRGLILNVMATIVDDKNEGGFEDTQPASSLSSVAADDTRFREALKRAVAVDESHTQKQKTLALLGAFAVDLDRAGPTPETAVSSDNQLPTSEQWFDEVALLGDEAGTTALQMSALGAGETPALEDGKQATGSQPVGDGKQATAGPTGDGKEAMPDEAQLGDWYGGGYQPGPGWQNPSGPGWQKLQPSGTYKAAGNVGASRGAGGYPEAAYQNQPGNDAATRETVAWAGEMANRLEIAEAAASAAEEAGRAATAKAAEAAAAATEEARREVSIAEKAETEATKAAKRFKKQAAVAVEEARVAKEALADAKAEANAAQALLRNESSRAIDEIAAARDAIKREAKRSSAAIAAAKQASRAIPGKVASLAKQKVDDAKKVMADTLLEERASAEAVRTEIENEVERELSEAQNAIDEAKAGAWESETRTEAAIAEAKVLQAEKEAAIAEAKRAEHALERLVSLQKQQNSEVLLSEQEATRLERILADRRETAADVETEQGVAAREKQRIEARASEAEGLVRDARVNLAESLEEKKALDTQIESARADAKARTTETRGMGKQSAEAKRAASDTEEEARAESGQEGFDYDTETDERVDDYEKNDTDDEYDTDEKPTGDDYDFEFQKVRDVKPRAKTKTSRSSKSRKRVDTQRTDTSTRAKSDGKKHRKRDSGDSLADAVTQAAFALELELFGDADADAVGGESNDPKKTFLSNASIRDKDETDAPTGRSVGDVLQEWHDDYEDDVAAVDIGDGEVGEDLGQENDKALGDDDDAPGSAAPETDPAAKADDARESKTKTVSRKPEAIHALDDEWSEHDFDADFVPAKEFSKATKPAIETTDNASFRLATLGFKDAASFSFGDLERNALGNFLKSFFAETAPNACPEKTHVVLVGDATETGSATSSGSKSRKLMSRSVSNDASTDVRVVVSCAAKAGAKETSPASSVSIRQKAKTREATDALRDALAEGSFASRLRNAGFRVEPFLRER